MRPGMGQILNISFISSLAMQVLLSVLGAVLPDGQIIFQCLTICNNENQTNKVKTNFKVSAAFCQIRNKPSKFGQILVNFCQSGEFSPNLVTLTRSYLRYEYLRLEPKNAFKLTQSQFLIFFSFLHVFPLEPDTFSDLKNSRRLSGQEIPFNFLASIDFISRFTKTRTSVARLLIKTCAIRRSLHFQ